MYYEEDDSDHFNGKNKCFRFNIKCFSSNNTNILFYYLNSILFRLRNKMFFVGFHYQIILMYVSVSV